MPLHTHPLTESEARSVCTWRYPAPYDAYDLPAWEDVVRLGWGIGEAAIRRSQFFALCMDGRLIGWFRLKPCSGYVSLGVGLAPDQCGHGLGQDAMRLVLTEAAAQYAGLPLRLEVRPFNRRAIRCYEHAGFQELGRCRADAPDGPTELILMEYRTGC